MRRTVSNEDRRPEAGPFRYSRHLSSSIPQASHHQRSSAQLGRANLEAAPRLSVSIDPLTWGNHREQLIRRLSRSSEQSAPLAHLSHDQAIAHQSWSDNPVFHNPRSSLSRHFTQSRRQSLAHANGRPHVPPELDPSRVSFSSSLQSLSSIIMGAGNRSPGISSAGSAKGSEPDETRLDGPSPGSTTATSPLLVSTGQSGAPGAVPTHNLLNLDPGLSAESPLPSPSLGTSPSASVPRSHPVNRAPPHHRFSQSRKVSHGAGSASPGSERSYRDFENRKPPLGVLGICALDSKARSKPCRNILNRINSRQEFEVIIFGDKIILDEEPSNWPLCDYLISFFSDGFPLEKAIEYVRLRRPYSVNDLPMQMVLWDRRLCLKILDKFEVPTPQRVEVTRDGGPVLPSPELAQHLFERTGVELEGPDDGTGGGVAPSKKVVMLDDDTISVDGVTLKKPFVEKPVSGEDHNIHIYYSSDVGGGGRRLFRKINNKSSEADPTLNVPRAITDQTSSFIYESFLSPTNHEDVKAYTVGSSFCHAETRKSPVVDGIVKRNTHGKEMRYVTALTPEEAKIAQRVAEAFGQKVCGFDLLRVGDKSYVIDVNGWSFVKDNPDYYEKCANILKQLFIDEKLRRDSRSMPVDGESQVVHGLPNKPAAGHLSTLKSILRSPSLTRLSAHTHHHSHSTHGHRRHDSRASGVSSDVFLQTPPMSSPPTIERPANSGLASVNGYHPDGLPSAVTVDGKFPDDVSGYDERTPAEIPPPAPKAQWKLKGIVAVIRHADRTPKQKFKFTFHTKPFVDLLKGHREEVLLIGEAALSSVMDATMTAIAQGVEDMDKLKLLRSSLAKKGAWPGTKVQIKPLFRKKKRESYDSTPTESPRETGFQPLSKDANQSVENGGEDPTKKRRQGSLTGVTLSREAAAEDNLEFEKLQLIIKWGGEPTHSARYQAQELGENMRNDLLLMNRNAIDDPSVYSSSERRVTTSAHIWTAAFLNQPEVPPNFIQVRKDLLDDSNAAKDEMDKVKKKLKGLLRQGHQAPSQFAWPENMPEPFIVARNTVELMLFHRKVMRHNFQKLYGGAASSLAAAVKSPDKRSQSPGASTITQAQNIGNIQNRWCCGEDAELFKERWEKLFAEFCDPEKVDPSKISELHDTMKFDALHNRPFLEWVFTPPPEMLEDTNEPSAENTDSTKNSDSAQQDMNPPRRSNTASSASDKPTEKVSLGERLGFRKKSVAIEHSTLQQYASDPQMQSYFNLFTGSKGSKGKMDVRLAKLRELFLYSKILFDFIGPQEYGITDSEKLEIGLLTSLPLLRAIVKDLEDVQAAEGAKTSVYFTKESHIYTLLNCIIEGGIPTKINRNKIPELDYLSTIQFELYESQNTLLDDAEDQFNYSIRITVSPGCHTFEPLDVVLDSKHCIGFAQRRSLTDHIEWKQVIETLRAKFHTVKLPKSFVAVNLAEKNPSSFSHSQEAAIELKKSASHAPQPDESELPVPVV